MALGNEGLARFELELRLHANTWARWKSSQRNEADLKRSIMEQRDITKERTDQRDQWQRTAEYWRATAKKRGTGEKLLALAAAIGLGFAIAK